MKLWSKIHKKTTCWHSTLSSDTMRRESTQIFKNLDTINIHVVASSKSIFITVQHVDSQLLFNEYSRSASSMLLYLSTSCYTLEAIMETYRSFFDLFTQQTSEDNARMAAGQIKMNMQIESKWKLCWKREAVCLRLNWITFVFRFVGDIVISNTEIFLYFW